MTMGPTSRTALATALAAALACCPAHVEEPVAVAPPAPVSITVSVRNETDRSVYYVNAAPCETEDWTQDLLGETNILGPGATVPIALTAGCWNLRAVDLDGGILAIEEGIVFENDGAWVLHPAYADHGGR